MDSAHDVQIRHPRFDHNDVGPFLDIERHFADRFVAVRWIHLVGLFGSTSEILCRPDGIAERTIECRSIFRCIAHEDHMLKTRLVQRLANRPDATVHHVRRSNDARSCLGL